MRAALKTSPAAGADTGELVLQWLESVPTALLLVDGDLDIHWANSTARQWLTTEAPLAKVGNQLHLGQSQQKLRRLISRADCDLNGICVPIEARGAHLIISARKISNDEGTPFFGLIARCTDHLQARLLGVEEAFGLTTAEVRVLELLMKGDTARKISVRLGVSIETVRTHIRRLYTKLEVRSREALFMRLRPFMMAA